MVTLNRFLSYFWPHHETLWMSCKSKMSLSAISWYWPWKKKFMTWNGKRNFRWTYVSSQQCRSSTMIEMHVHGSFQYSNSCTLWFISWVALFWMHKISVDQHWLETICHKLRMESASYIPQVYLQNLLGSCVISMSNMWRTWKLGTNQSIDRVSTGEGEPY